MPTTNREQAQAEPDPTCQCCDYPQSEHDIDDLRFDLSGNCVSACLDFISVERAERARAYARAKEQG